MVTSVSTGSLQKSQETLDSREKGALIISTREVLEEAIVVGQSSQRRLGGRSEL